VGSLRFNVVASAISMHGFSALDIAEMLVMPSTFLFEDAARIVVASAGQIGFGRRAQAAFLSRTGGRDHANQPCSIQSDEEPADANAQPRWPDWVSIT
jgi:hypothetical protein